MPPDDRDEVADVLVVDLLGGIGDLVMLLPSLRGLARRHPGAAVRVLTHAPGATLLDPDPDVAEVRAVRKGGERTAVVAELERRPPDLVVSTTRFGPASVSITSSSSATPRLRAMAWARQRMPLPLISARLPSALNSAMRPSR